MLEIAVGISLTLNLVFLTVIWILKHEADSAITLAEKSLDAEAATEARMTEIQNILARPVQLVLTPAVAQTIGQQVINYLEYGDAPCPIHDGPDSGGVDEILNAPIYPKPKKKEPN